MKSSVQFGELSFNSTSRVFDRLEIESCWRQIISVCVWSLDPRRCEPNVTPLLKTQRKHKNKKVADHHRSLCWKYPTTTGPSVENINPAKALSARDKMHSVYKHVAALTEALTLQNIRFLKQKSTHRHSYEVCTQICLLWEVADMLSEHMACLALQSRFNSKLRINNSCFKKPILPNPIKISEDAFSFFR